MKSNLLFFALPCIAASLLAVGIVVRYLLERRQMTAVREEMSEAWALLGGGRLWRAGLLLLIGGHAISLLRPQAVLAWNSAPGRLYLLEAIMFLAGLAALAGWMRILWRHLGRSNRSAIVELSDTVFLALLLLGILSGLLMAVLYRWGSSWGAIILTPYIGSLLRGNPSVMLAAQMPFLVRLHLFSAFAALAVLPLTRLAAFFVFALHRVLGLAGRPVSAAGRFAGQWARRHSPAAWLWPEED